MPQLLGVLPFEPGGWVFLQVALQHFITVDDHGAEFPGVEITPASTDAAMTEEDRSRRVESHPQADSCRQRQDNHPAEHGEEQVDRALCQSFAAVEHLLPGFETKYAADALWLDPQAGEAK